MLGHACEPVGLGDRAYRRCDEGMLDRILHELAADEQPHAACFQAVEILVDGFQDASPSQLERAEACAVSARLDVRTPTWPASTRRMRAPCNASAHAGGVMLSDAPEMTSFGQRMLASSLMISLFW